MRKLLLSLFFIMLTVSAQAQTIGITGNLAFDKAESDLIKGFKPGLGWGAGLKLRMVSHTGLGIDLAFKYDSEKISFVSMEGDKNITNEKYDHISLLSIPLNLRYDFAFPAMKKVAFPYLFVGPEFSYAFSNIDWKETKIGDYFKESKALWNLNLGVGVIFIQHIELSYNYTFKITDRLEKNSTLSENIDKIYESSSNKISLTYYFK